MNPSSRGTLGLSRRLKRFLTILPLLLAAATGCHACASHRALEKEIAAASRDPQTGVILGTEALDLGPQESSTACLLVHGFVGSRRDFADLGDQLAAQGHFVRMMRLPGHGTTPREFAELEPEDLVIAARDELTNLQQRFDRVVLIGFSMGGAISTILASEQGRRLDGLVLVAPYYKVTYYGYYILPPMTWNRMLAPLAPYVIKSERFVRVNRREAVPEIFSYRAIPTRGALTLEALGKRARSPETLSTIEAPVLMLQAEGDEAASPEAGRVAFEQIGSKQKDLHVYSDQSNHHLLWDYDREDAKRRVLDFVGSLRAEEGASATAFSGEGRETRSESFHKQNRSG